MAIDPAIYLDPSIRNWVVLPLMGVMVLVGLCRHYVIQLIQSETLQEKEELGYHQTLGRSSRLRGNGQFLRKDAFYSRKSYFTNKDDGVLKKKVRGGPINPMMNPDGMMGMMKNNMVYMIPNMGMMAFVSYFFSGFVVCKIPFPLTSRFKMMLQRGIDLSTLEVSYVSSLSWYFLLMFGMQGLFSLILGENSGADETRMMQAQMGMGGGVNMQFDPTKAYAQEADSLMLVPHTFALEDVEKTLLGKKYPVLYKPDANADGKSGGSGNASGRLNPMDRLRARRVK